MSIVVGAMKGCGRSTRGVKGGECNSSGLRITTSGGLTGV
jgi:hypothetical protein